MRILIATDAWAPQINGVVRTYAMLAEALRSGDDEIVFLTPCNFSTVRLPLYPEIRLAIPNRRKAELRIKAAKADFIHIATEGPVGLTVRRFCLENGLPFTTSYHTKFPEYLTAFLRLPPALGYQLMRRFHNSAAGTMVATPSLGRDLAARGFTRLLPWTRGVDTERFKPRRVRMFGEAEPVFLYVGRVSREKNVDGFLRLSLPGRKVVVGDGPMLQAYERQYPDTRFVGAKTGEELAECYASADVFVFPSRTDTFGLVMLEAMASGLPVAALPVTGPIDVIADGVSGVLDHDLARAALAAVDLDRDTVRRHALEYGCRRMADTFIENIKLVRAEIQVKAVRSANSFVADRASNLSNSAF